MRASISCLHAVYDERHNLFTDPRLLSTAGIQEVLRADAAFQRTAL